MYYDRFMMKTFLITIFLCLFGGPSFVHAHHCGPTQPLPEFPRHSCKTHTQTWQPGEKLDEHPGGAKGRGPGNNPPSCTYYVDPSQIEEMLRAQPGVCQRYGPDRIICDANANTTQADGGGSAPGPDTWKQKLANDIVVEVERRAAQEQNFDRTPTEIKIDVKNTGANSAGVTKSPYSRTYWNVFNKVLKEFSNAGKTVPPNNRPYSMTVKLGTPQPTSQPTDPSQPSDGSCTYVAGKPFQLGANKNTTVDNRPPLTPGIDKTEYPAPQPVQPPEIQVVYGRMWWKPSGQKLYFPIDIQVPNSVSLNLDQIGPLSAGPAGQYYGGFKGHLVTKWNPQTGSGGSFRIMQLQLVGGGWESIFEWQRYSQIAGYPVQLGPTPLPPAAPTTNPQ